MLKVLVTVKQMISKGFIESTTPLKPMTEEELQKAGNANAGQNKMVDRGWTGMNKKKSNNDLATIDSLLGLMYGLELDYKNKIDSFQSVGMCDPFDPKDSINEAI